MIACSKNERPRWHAGRRSSESVQPHFTERERCWKRAMARFHRDQCRRDLHTIAIALQRNAGMEGGAQ